MDFEAVYYSGPSPRSLRSLTLLGLVFDRLIFPGVYVPTSGVDVQDTARELERLRGLPPRRDPDVGHILNLMALALNVEHWSDLCSFTGSAGVAGSLEEGAKQLTHELELAIFGPPPESFLPTISLGFSKGLAGDDTACVNAPSWLSYPANALLYAARTGTVLINDDPTLPVPSIRGSDLRAQAKQLATIMALETVKFVLPNLKPLSLQELAEFRQESRATVRPFRQAMLRLSKDLNAAILSDMSLEDVRKEARFIVETTVAPEVEQLKETLARPSKPWHRRLVDVASTIPELAGAFATMPMNVAAAMSLAKVAGVLADVRDAQLEREGLIKRGGFHYLLQLKQLKS